MQKIKIVNIDQDFSDNLINIGKTEEKIPADFESASGSLGIAINLAKQFSNLKADLMPNASGNLDPAATLLIAIGEPKYRIASKETTLTLGKAGHYPQGATENDLTSEDRDLLEILSAITGEKDLILDKILSGQVIDANTAIDLKLIDEVQTYKDKYKRRRGRKKSDNAAKGETDK